LDGGGLGDGERHSAGASEKNRGHAAADDITAQKDEREDKIVDTKRRESACIYAMPGTVNVVRPICGLQFENGLVRQSCTFTGLYVLGPGEIARQRNESTIRPNVHVYSEEREGDWAKKTHGTLPEPSDSLTTFHAAWPPFGVPAFL